MGSESRTLDQRFPGDLITESDINQRDSVFVHSRDESFPNRDENLAAELQKVQSVSLGLNQHAVHAYVAAPGNSCKGLLPGIEPNTTVNTLLENLRCSEAPILHARMMGSTNEAFVTLSAIRVPRHFRLYGAELRCYILRPRQQICSVCLFMGHRADVSPTPDKPHCDACGTSNPLPEHECTPKCIVEAIIPPWTLGVHRVNNGRLISRMCSRNVSNAKSCVPYLDQHIVSLGRLRALCGIRT
ncbi:hypothetical protein HPB49_000892 [Dermacentor silvarum]|uniref:Uncharacterized protein n=1 Tax=Dermacentor silvarum TaxID=543639 RepID=A0ACB8DI10_DERSI|nr:hypothetical protein HPB49_000892 [Dermacentor silvarum]